MADQRIASLLETCDNSDRGCFASDQAAFETMMYMDDGGVRANLTRIGIAADDAGQNGTPLAEATYKEVTLETTGTFPYSESRYGYGHFLKIGNGESKRIGELLDGSDSTAARVARCAYVCGQIGVGNCPLKDRV